MRCNCNASACAPDYARVLCAYRLCVCPRPQSWLGGEADFRHVFSLAGRDGLPATVLFRYPTLATTSPCAMTGSMHAGMWLLLPLFQPPPWIHNTAANAFPPGPECVSVSPLCPSPSALAGSGLQMSSSSGVPSSAVPVRSSALSTAPQRDGDTKVATAAGYRTKDNVLLCHNRRRLGLGWFVFGRHRIPGLSLTPLSTKTRR